MVRILAVLFILLCWWGSSSSKHVYVDTPLSWLKAQAYCRQNHVDLSPISSPRDEQTLRRLAEAVLWAWVGLYRDPSDQNLWRWSGGGELASYQNWDIGQPDQDYTVGAITVKEEYGVVYFKHWNYTRWHNTIQGRQFTFFCYQLVVVPEKRTWEEALDHCRNQSMDLLSQTSDSQVLLAQAQLTAWRPTQPSDRTVLTDRLWIGLRYLGSRWLWVDGEPQEFQAWEGGGVGWPQCPASTHLCGATLRTGGWVPNDCTERLHFICH